MVFNYVSEHETSPSFVIFKRMPHIYFRFQNRIEKVEFESNVVTAEKAKFLISQKIGTSDVLELSMESDGSIVKERQLLDPGTTVTARRTANKSYRQSMRDTGGSQHRKRLRNAPTTGDVVIDISRAKTSDRRTSIMYSGGAKEIEDDEYSAMYGDQIVDAEALEERKLRILQENIRSAVRSDFQQHPSGRIPLSAKGTLNAQRKNAAQRSAETSFVDPPPKNYVCHACGYAGHWIYDCIVVKSGSHSGSSESFKVSEKAASAAQQNMEAAKPESMAKDAPHHILAKYMEQLSKMQYWGPEDIEKANHEAENAELWSV